MNEHATRLRARGPLDVGITCTLKSAVTPREGQPDDALVEYDSESTLEAVRAALERAGHRARFLGYGEALVEALRGPRPDLVFNFAEGVGGRSRATHVPALLEMLGVPYTHADPVCLAVTQDKAIAKHLVRAHGVNTPRFVVIERAAQLAAVDLAYPLIAKPLGEGSSMGIGDDARVEGRDALETLVRRLLQTYRAPVLVEEFCPGAEFTVGIVGSGEGARVLGTSSFTPTGPAPERFVYSLAIKQLADWSPFVTIESPPRCDAATRAAVESCALAAYRVLGCRDVGRVDVRVDARGEPSFLEVNPLPGLAPGYSDLTVIADAAGLGYDGLIATIVDEARARLRL